MNNKIFTYPFGESFIDHLVDRLEEHYFKKGKDLSRVALVFGGKRPALFVKKALAERLKKSFYAPRFFTVDELITYAIKKKESFRQTQDLDNSFLLYHLAQRHAPQILRRRETFAEFLPWTHEILSFIDHLDLENIKESSLQHIESNAQIGYPVPEDINRLLESIVLLRKAYHKELFRKKTYSRGLQYLRAAELIDKVQFPEFDEFLFCNFFYFHACEEIVAKSLYERDQATLIFQGDARRWPVLKRIAQNFSCSIKEADEPVKPNFALHLYSGFDTHSQIGIVHKILKGLKNPNNTVVLLPNPETVIPLLSQVTSVVKDFNISMGYPLKRSSLYSLCEFIFKAQLSKKEGMYYAKDYLKSLRHPFIKNLKLSTSSTVTRVLIHKIEEILTGKEKSSFSGNLFVHLDEIKDDEDLYLLTKVMLKRLGLKASKEQLKSNLQKIHDVLFNNWEKINNFQDFASCLEQFLDILTEKSFLRNYPLNINIATKMYALKDEFLHASFQQEQFSVDEIFRIFKSKVAREMVAFLGSPLKGLQILGLFETRSLNFENVIVLDVNEGSLPKLNIYEPLIPREVMIGLNLDRLELEEEIQRYQFMRLISSAKNVHLVYQQSKDKEKSRFVEELIWEEQKRLNKVDVISPTQARFEVKVSSQKREVPKTPAMMKALRDFRFSASSINTYLRDPMEFYTNYVLRLKEKEDLLDEPEARHVGTFVHELLEESFQVFLNKQPHIDSAFRNRFLKMFETKFDETFGRSMKSDGVLLKSVMQERLHRFLDHEKNQPERQIQKLLHLEREFEETILLSKGAFKFKYVVDRVDQLQDGTIMIIDYKTGGTDLMPKAIDTIASMELSRDSIRENVKSFQIPLYFHYLDKQFKDQPINAALYNLRTLKLHKFIDQKNSFSRDEINKTFLRALDYIVSEILDPDVAFVQEG